MATSSSDVNGLPLRHKDEGRALYQRIISLLPCIYSNNSNDYTLKGFTISLTTQTDCFTATAIAKLRLPESLDAGSDEVLNDEFLECYHEHSALAALRLLEIEVRKKARERERDVKTYQDMFSFNMRW